jgi:ribosomal protein S18 acetylase RimI-like enzyme
MINIRVFKADEWSVYKNLRLSALTDSPDAFGSTLANETIRSDDEWSRRLTTGVNSSKDLPILAEIDNQPIGLAWVRIDDSDLNVANLYQVWVAPGYRFLGTGKMLLDAVISWASAKQACYLDLGVTCGGTPAMRLYTRAGFEPVGQPQPIRPGAEVLSQHMRLKLKQSAA